MARAVTPPKPNRDERARRALSEFREIQPALTAYAVNLTGKSNVRVEATGNSAHGGAATDGTKIYLRPPLLLGDISLRNHRRGPKCDQRDDQFQILCDVCSAREFVLAITFHEISHIAFDSFVKVGKTDLATVTRMVHTAAPAWYAERVDKRFKDAGLHRFPTLGYNQLGSVISPYLAALVGALEDVRIDQRMIDARPGTAIMKIAKIYKTAREGVEQPDTMTGEVRGVAWREYDPNQQAVLGCLLIAGGFDPSKWLIEPVVNVLRDRQIRELLATVDGLPNVSSIFTRAFEIFLRLRELGFLILADEEPPPTEPEAPELPPEESDDDDTDDTQPGTDGSLAPEGDGEAGVQPPATPDEAGSTGSDSSDDVDNSESGSGGDDTDGQLGGEAGSDADDDSNDESQSHGSESGSDSGDGTSAEDASPADEDDADASSDGAAGAPGASGNSGKAHGASGGTDSDSDAHGAEDGSRSDESDNRGDDSRSEGDVGDAEGSDPGAGSEGDPSGHGGSSTSEGADDVPGTGSSGDRLEGDDQSGSDAEPVGGDVHSGADSSVGDNDATEDSLPDGNSDTASDANTGDFSDGEVDHGSEGGSEAGSQDGDDRADHEGSDDSGQGEEEGGLGYDDDLADSVDPLDYKPDADSAIDATDRKIVYTPPPTMTSG